MKKFKYIAYIILIAIIIVLSLTIYTSATKDNESDKKEKTLSEINFLESKIVNLLNSMNNIEFQNYNVSISEMSKASEEQTSGGSSGETGNSNNSQGSGSSNSSSGSNESDSSGGNSQQSNKTSQEENQDNKKFELKSSGILLNDNKINWDNVKNEVEILYTSLPTITLDLYNIDLNQDDILNFNKDFDNLTLQVKNENKEETLKGLAKIYDYIAKFAKNATDDDLHKNMLEIKKEIFKSYSILDSEDWNVISENVTNAIGIYSKILSDKNIDENKQYSINKGYIMINELKNSIELKDKAVFLIKYKNLLEEINNI